jgi:D-sedoheptulose 7-phosphate isomerase
MINASVTHLDALSDATVALRPELEHIERLGARAAEILLAGGRMLAAGNGGSAAQAQHLTAELVGRFQHERQPLSAIALHADTSSLTAISNDYGASEIFARQVQAHGRPGDVLVLLSTSGRSPNVLAAADAGRTVGVHVWGLTGPQPNPLASRCDEVVAVASSSTATVQEVHLVVIHLLCAAIDAVIVARELQAVGR